MQVIQEYSTPYYKHILSLPPSSVRKMWKKNEIVLIDVRTPQEYEDHHIPGSILVPLDYLEALAKFLPKDKDVAVICEHGNRAMYATYGMPHIWKKRAIHMQYGMVGWMSMGYETEYGMDENGRKWEEWLDKL
ncbi:rhodanese-like domain-containing protein [Acidianus sulfidivorans JP7]|uniref:Rhodanese n=1 Tax=Acidianus sulfidivorans JP7 TaxID=619593 RepID=A0A2U9IKB6_9CREN|nr:rhodanese-like domain-containing protein [Acidianus sulfidivorans]AWR96492.1 rhodanese-like domain-containing protein [Acidianus sulfidivorans JP7]